MQFEQFSRWLTIPLIDHQPTRNSSRSVRFNIKLLGIAVTPDGASARIRDNSDGTLHSLDVGDVFNTWHVDSIGADTLAMSKNDRRVYDLFAKLDITDKTSAAVHEIRPSASKSLLDSRTGIDCADAASNCDEEKHHQQDLIDFFGSKAK